MELTYKADFERVKDVWRHFWNGEMVRRPVVVAQVSRPGRSPGNPGHLRYLRANTRRWEEQLAAIDGWLEDTVFLAEAVPHFSPDHGPDQFACFYGGRLEHSADSPETNWVHPFVDGRWEAVLPLRLDREGSVWTSVMGLSRRLAEHARGRYLVGACDLHSNLDTLLAMRGGEGLCMDLIEQPEAIGAAMADVRQAYPVVYDELYRAGGMSAETGSIGWIPFWSDGRFATIQCDALCMISPQISRKIVLPALEEEAEFLDHCVLHFDGPGALPHLDDVLSIKAIDAIQWVPGDGQKPMREWIDVLQRCQAAGKAVQVYGVNPEHVRQLHRILKPEKTVYCVEAEHPDRINELLYWLEKNT